MFRTIWSAIIAGAVSSVHDVGEGVKRHIVLVPNTHVAKDMTSDIDAREERLYRRGEERSMGPFKLKDAQFAETLDGFCDVVNRHKTPITAISAIKSRDGKGITPEIRAIIDYHEPSNGEVGPIARWKNHTVTYSFPRSDAFKAWQGAGAWMSKKQFLEFVDRRRLDVMSPESAEGGLSPIVEQVFRSIVASKQATREERAAMTTGDVFGSYANLLQGARAMIGVSSEKLEEVYDDNGVLSVKYEKNAKAEGASAHRFYLISVHVFEGDEQPTLIPVRLDLKIEDGGQLFVRVELLALDRIAEEAFTSACEAIATKTELPVYRATL